MREQTHNFKRTQPETIRTETSAFSLACLAQTLAKPIRKPSCPTMIVSSLLLVSRTLNVDPLAFHLEIVSLRFPVVLRRMEIILPDAVAYLHKLPNIINFILHKLIFCYRIGPS